MLSLHNKDICEIYNGTSDRHPINKAKSHMLTVLYYYFVLFVLYILNPYNLSIKDNMAPIKLSPTCSLS